MREKLASRFGFLMLAAGCAVGLGNVWRFPYVTGRNGGGAFVLVYLAFLLILGFPLLIAELSLGRASKRGISRALAKLGAPRRPLATRRFLRILGSIIFAGNFILMIYYTDVAGWLVKYASDYISSGSPVSFPDLVADKTTSTIYMLLCVVAASAVCFAGVVKGVERVTKVLMASLLVLLAGLAAKALSLDAAAEGVKFFLYPDWARFMEHPWRGVLEAMGQAFFTLSLGIGCMMIFGSYVQRKHSLVKEASLIILIDTLVALLSGLVIFPACISYGIEPSSGPGLIFIALPEVFTRMTGGRFWGFCFFLFLAFAAFTTIVAVFECIIGGMKDEFSPKSPGGSAALRRKVAIYTGIAVAVCSLPCVFFDGVLAIEDFAVSQLWLPLGALVQSLFVALPIGWSWQKFRNEASLGDGAALPDFLRLHYIITMPLLILVVIITGIMAQ